MVDSNRSVSSPPKAPGSSEGSRGRRVGRYVVHDRIAAGGMATVHLGRLLGAAGFARTVAIKRLHDQYARDPEFVAAEHLLAASDVIVIGAPHTIYRELEFPEDKEVVDVWGFLGRERMKVGVR